MSLTTIKRILRAHDVTVVGSAPLSNHEIKKIESSDRLICINGSISSTTRVPDIWVLNSRHYDDELYTDPNRWPEERKRLHEEMLKQSIGRKARHVLFVLKSYTPNQTIQRLKDQGTSWRGQTVLSPGHKTDLVRSLGVNKFSTAFNISAGLLGACISLYSKAKSVTMCGFSFNNNYQYLSSVPSDTRKHIPQDKEALADLIQIHSNLIIPDGLLDCLSKTGEI